MAKQGFWFLWLAAIIIGVFILQQLIPAFTDFFILNSKAIDNFEIWRYLTAIFLHGGIIHLIYNLFALLFFGIILEKKIGSKMFLVVFLGSGIIANIISVNFYDSSLGASGAIYGVLGSVAVIAPLMMVWAFGLIVPMFIAAGLWIAADVLRILGMFGETNIGSIAHLSGIGIGIIAGLLFRLLKKDKNSKKEIDIPEIYVDEWERRYMHNYSRF